MSKRMHQYPFLYFYEKRSKLARLFQYIITLFQTFFNQPPKCLKEKHILQFLLFHNTNSLLFFFKNACTNVYLEKIRYDIAD